jgi:hypothetical protein
VEEDARPPLCLPAAKIASFELKSKAQKLLAQAKSLLVCAKVPTAHEASCSNTKMRTALHRLRTEGSRKREPHLLTLLMA